jgi:radical SAM protein with 4Fe4S-binding SPASM domain
MEPTYFIGIDYNGNAMPCCNMRSDYDEHQPFILGNIAEQSLEEIYNSNKAAAIRKLTSTGIPDADAIELIGAEKYPCMFCTKGEGRYTRDNPGIDY